jgi:hypothetical protein
MPAGYAAGSAQVPARYEPPSVYEPTYGTQPYPESAYGTPPYAGYGYPMVAAAPTNALAIASLVCSLLGLAVFVTAPVGAILGHVARRRIRQTGESGDGMALAGIIIGWTLTGLLLLCCGLVLIPLLLLPFGA